MEIAGFFAAPMGCAKPDPRIFREALRRIRAAPGEVLFVDDREENVAAALQAGLRAFQAKGGAEVAEGLRRWGVMEPVRPSPWREPIWDPLEVVRQDYGARKEANGRGRKTLRSILGQDSGCTGCAICAKACPARNIEMVRERPDRRHLSSHRTE